MKEKAMGAGGAGTDPPHRQELRQVYIDLLVVWMKCTLDRATLGHLPSQPLPCVCVEVGVAG